MFWTTAPAGLQYLTLTALTGQLRIFILAKVLLSGRINHLSKALLAHIAESILRVDIMIAGVDVPIMLNHQRSAAGRLMMANRARRADKAGKRPFDIHHKNFADVMFDPAIENGYQKIAVVLRTNRPFRYPAL